jgi:hypothetical protein
MIDIQLPHGAVAVAVDFHDNLFLKLVQIASPRRTQAAQRFHLVPIVSDIGGRLRVHRHGRSPIQIHGGVFTSSNGLQQGFDRSSVIFKVSTLPAIALHHVPRMRSNDQRPFL